MHRNFVSVDCMGCMSKTELRANKSNLKVWYFQVTTTTKKQCKTEKLIFTNRFLSPSFPHIQENDITGLFFVFCCFLFSKFSNFSSLISKPKSIGRRCSPWQSRAAATAHKRIKASQWALNYSLYENALAAETATDPLNLRWADVSRDVQS